MHRTYSPIGASTTGDGGHLGLRMTAEGFFSLPESDSWLELVDGVVVMSPSPTPLHQKVAFWLAAQLAAHLERHPVGEAFLELDVHLGCGPKGADIVYRPDLVFLRTERVAACRQRIVGPPDLVVEIVSETSRRFDRETKKVDYERCGVHEYWIIDPECGVITFFRAASGRFAEVPSQADLFVSQAVPGFALDLSRLRKAFLL